LADGLMVWDADTCTGCDTCLAVCPYDASPKARTLEVDDLLVRCVDVRARGQGGPQAVRDYIASAAPAADVKKARAEIFLSVKKDPQAAEPEFER